MNVLNGRGADAMKSQRYVFVYVLNVLSCFAEVVLHTTLPVYTEVPRLKVSAKLWLVPHQK